MTILRVEHIAKRFGDVPVLDDISFELANQERMGLVGANGAGKSTLLQILLRRLEPDGGGVSLAKGRTVGYLPQSFHPHGNMTIQAWLEVATKELRQLEERMTQLTEAMSRAAPNEVDAMLTEYGDVATQFEERGGYELGHRIQTIVEGLGIAHIDTAATMATLSGGEQVRFGLAAVLIQQPDVLFLDEPTNHLDKNALAWLEEYLAAYRGVLIVVSHDRYFLNQVVNRILEIDEFTHRAKSYPGNYDAYVQQKAEERKRWERQYAEQQDEIRALKKRIIEATTQVGHNRPPTDNHKMAYFGHGQKVQQTVARRVHSAEVQLERLFAEAVPRPPDAMRFVPHFEAETSTHAFAVSVSDLTVVTERGQTLFSNVRFTLGTKQRMLIAGPNGVGKTTLLDLIAGSRKPNGGTVLLPARTKLAYLRQNMEVEDERQTVLDCFRNGLEGTKEQHIAQLLSFQLFRFEEFQLRCGYISPGQQRKLMIAKMMASGANLLLLDEPTNHIGLSILEAFEEALDVFPGAIIAVSHDRRFIERFQGSKWNLVDGTLAAETPEHLSERELERMRADIQDLSQYVQTGGTQPLSMNLLQKNHPTTN